MATAIVPAPVPRSPTESTYVTDSDDQSDDDQFATAADRRRRRLVRGGPAIVANASGHPELHHSRKHVHHETRWETTKKYVSIGVRYVASDTERRPRNCCLGFWAMFIVVFFVGLILVGISKTPVVFLRFAELTIGEMDGLIIAQGGTLPFVNYTDIEPRIRVNASLTRDSVPRWLLKGQLEALNGSVSAASGANGTNATSNASISTPARVLVNILLADTSRETAAGVGRAWPYRQIGFAEGQVLRTVLRFINVTANIGQRARMIVDVGGILQQQQVDVNGLLGVAPAAAGPAAPVATAAPVDVNASTAVGPNLTFAGLLGQLSGNTLDPTAVANAINVANLSTAFNNAAAAVAGAGGVNPALAAALLTPALRITVADGFAEPAGKYPATLGNMVVVDYHDVVAAVLEQLCYESLRSPLSTFVGSNGPTIAALPSSDTIASNFRLTDYALVVVTMMKERFETYYQSVIPRTRAMIRYSDDLFLSLGVSYAASAQYPLSLGLIAFDFFALFLNSVFQTVVAIIVILGALVMYSLMATNADERAYEVAMMRAQGMAKPQLLFLMISQAIVFSLPAIVTGIAALIAMNALVEIVLTLFTYGPARTTNIDIVAVVIPAVLAIAVLFLANWGPIVSALARSLRDALDVYRNTGTETQVTQIRLTELGIEPWQALVGWMLVIIGFLVYYMIPFSFIFNELWLFFLILNGILVAMLIGLCLVSVSIEGPLQRAVLRCLLWRGERRLKPLILKNLSAHSERNTKSYIMFTMSVACIVFGGVLFTLLAKSGGMFLAGANGADVTISSLTVDFPLNRSTIDEFLATVVVLPRRNQSDVVAIDGVRSRVVEAWSYATFGVVSYAQFSSTRISNLVGFPSSRHDIVGLDETFLDAVYPQYVQAVSVDPGVSTTLRSSTGVTDFVRVMYREQRLSLAGVGSAANDDGDGGGVQLHLPIYTGYPPNETLPNLNGKAGFRFTGLLSSAAKTVIGAAPGASINIDLEYRTGSGTSIAARDTSFLGGVLGLFDKIPGFADVSPLPFGFVSSSYFVPIPTFEAILGVNRIDFPRETTKAPGRYEYSDNKSSTAVKYRVLFVRLRADVTSAERSYFVDSLQARVNPYYHIASNTVELIATTQTASDVIIYFFFFSSAVTIILDTMMLWLAFLANVQVNAWSFAVLRSLGFTAKQLTRAYVYEALTLVLSSFIVGTAIGLIVASTIMLQINVFLQLPFNMDFPWQLFLFLFLLSIVSSVCASVIPARALSRRSISVLLKKG